ncbi:MAG TPA: TonB-dependent receptor [Gemmatimonadaceae bacterium]|nr:TonB-dependent receptor [Gemmatimonadaceae bacterium]
MWAKRVCLAAALFLASSAVAQAQTGRIAGAVVDSQTTQPVTGARISVVGTSLITASDADGRFSIGGVPAGPQQIRVTRIGYAPVLRTVDVGSGATATLNVTMRSQAVQLNPVVSIGYGMQRLSDVTGSVATVNTAVLEKTPIATIDQMLQGTSPGVQVTTASSEPGGAISIRIRGASSITGNSEPLYVIDGFPIENDIAGSAVGNAGRDRTTPPNPLVTINPSDIESISILKDASATAIYGARGANGVVIITTKQGRGSKPQFTIESYAGAARLARKYDLLDSEGFMLYANEYYKNSSQPFVPFPDTTISRILASGINTDWQDEIFRTGPVSNLQFSVRGATSTNQSTRYALSLGRYVQDGIVVGSGLQRLSSRLNLTQDFGRVQLSGSVSASQARSKSTPTAGQQNSNAGAVSGALQYVPILPVFRPDGTYTLLNPDLNVYGSQLNAAPAPNPVSLAREVSDSLGDTRMLGNFAADIGLMKDLKFRVSLGADYANRYRHTYYPRTTLRGSSVGGEAIRADGTTYSWVNENTLTWDKRFGSQALTLLGGYSRQRTDANGDNESNTNFVSDITSYFDIGSGTREGGPSVGSRQSTQTLESYLTRLNYSLLDRYLLTLTYRNDGSSRFASGKKRGGFPSMAIAWRASEEPFLSSHGIIDELKFRMSVGTVGNPSIRPYQSLARLNDQAYSFNGSPASGYYPISVANPDLTWESTHQFDAGFDLGLAQRMNLTVDYYRKKTTDLLLQIDLPLESGFESALANRGSVENKGIEVGLEADVLRGGNDGLRWRTNINFAKNRNKVLNLGGPDRLFADLLTTDYNFPGTTIQVGQPIGEFYGFKALGVIPDQAAADAITYKNFTVTAFKPGDMLLADLDGDGVITAKDRTNIGDPTPDFNYGFSNTFTWRRFELSGLLQGSHGGKILNVNRIRTEAEPRANISRDRWEGRWTPENPNAKYPRVGANPNTVGPNNFSSNLLEDGSYLRLRTVTLSYGAPAWLFGARLYITGTNLVTWTDYTGFDPDVSGQSVGNTNRGIDIGAYPLAKTIIAGLNINY